MFEDYFWLTNLEIIYISYYFHHKKRKKIRSSFLSLLLIQSVHHQAATMTFQHIMLPAKIISPFKIIHIVQAHSGFSLCPINLHQPIEKIITCIFQCSKKVHFSILKNLHKSGTPAFFFFLWSAECQPIHS